MFKQSLRKSVLFKVIALVTIQTFIFTSSAFSYPTFGNLSKVEKDLRVIPTRKAEKSEEIEGRLGGRELAWDNDKPVDLRLWEIDPDNPNRIRQIANHDIWAEKGPDGRFVSRHEARSPEPDLFRNFELLSRIPSYEQLRGKIIGKNVLIKVNMNEPEPEKDATRLDMQKPIIDFVLKEGGTPILYGHGGRINRTADKKTVKEDDRFSFDAQSKYIAGLFPEKRMVFHKGCINRYDIDKGEGLMIGRHDIARGAINIIENVRFDQGAEAGWNRKKFADDLANLSDGFFVIDAFGDMDSKGASVENVPLSSHIKEVYLGPEMAKEFAAIRTILEEGFDAMVTGGNKLEKLVKLEGAIKQSLNEGGFVLLGSGLSNALDESPGQLAKFQAIEGKEIISSDYSDGTHNDIGEKAVGQFLAKLDSLKAGNKVVLNGTMGLMEGDEKYKEGTEKIFAKLDELADRGVKIIVVGGDATKAAKKYGLFKNRGVQSFSGGGVALTLLSGEVARGIKALSEAQERIVLAKADREKGYFNKHWSKVFSDKIFEIASQKIEDFEDENYKRGIIVNYELFLDNPVIAMAFISARRQWGDNIKLVLAIDNPKEANKLIENIYKASNGVVDLNGVFDKVIMTSAKSNEVLDVKMELNVDKILLIGPKNWALEYRYITEKTIEDVVVVICNIEEGKVAQGDQAFLVALNLLVKYDILSEKEKEELAKHRDDPKGFFVVEPMDIEEDMKPALQHYRKVAASG